MYQNDADAVRQTLNQYAAACNAGDFEGWLALWAEEGVQMPPGAPTRVGREQIREGMQQAFEAMDLALDLHAIEDVHVAGDRALTRCTYSLKLTPKAGGDAIDAMPRGKALTLYARQADGSWRIVYDCFNSSLPPAPGADAD